MAARLPLVPFSSHKASATSRGGQRKRRQARSEIWTQRACREEKRPLPLLRYALAARRRRLAAHLASFKSGSAFRYGAGAVDSAETQEGPNNPRDDGDSVCDATEVQPCQGATLSPPRRSSARKAHHEAILLRQALRNYFMLLGRVHGIDAVPSSRAFQVAFSLTEKAVHFGVQRCPSRAPSLATRQGGKFPTQLVSPSCPYGSLGGRMDHHLLIFPCHVEVSKYALGLESILT